ncbi:hypothetical protein ACFX2C_006763 [Malus domestica]
MPFISQGSTAIHIQPRCPIFPHAPYSIDGSMFPQVPYSPTSYMMPLSVPHIYPDFTNVYGFIGNGNLPRPFPNSNNGSRSFFGSKPEVQILEMEEDNFLVLNKVEVLGSLGHGILKPDLILSQSVKSVLNVVTQLLIVGSDLLVLVLWDRLWNVKYVASVVIVLWIVIIAITLPIKAQLLLLPCQLCKLMLLLIFYLKIPG